jgi:Uma2 family endonuclease
MTTTRDLETTLQLAENRVVFRDATWASFEALLQLRGDVSVPRITYYQGILELMSPSEAHEQASDRISDFIKILVEELERDIKSMASTTLKYPGLEAGAEPDKCFYLQHEPLVRGREVDLTQDPPPDLVVEVDFTNTDIRKKEMYQQMGVPEFWRYSKKSWLIYQLADGQYQAVDRSPSFPQVDKTVLAEFLQDCQTLGETMAKRKLRQWIRDHLLA